MLTFKPTASRVLAFRVICKEGVELEIISRIGQMMRGIVRHKLLQVANNLCKVDNGKSSGCFLNSPLKLAEAHRWVLRDTKGPLSQGEIGN